MSVSRNVLGTATDFDAFELNIIGVLLVSLRRFMYVAGNNPDPGEFYLRFSSISGRHVIREELVERINKLRQKEIRYKLTVPGVNLQVITGLFSSIIVASGGVMVRISPEAIPWLFYIGGGVGYAQIEPELLIGMKSIYHKRLYLLLCFKLYNGATSFKVRREQILQEISMSHGVPIHDVISRYFLGLKDYLETQGSMYCFSFEPIYRPGIKAGHPTIEGFSMTFTVRPEILAKAKKQGPNVESLNLLYRLIPILRKRIPGVMTPSEIHNHLLEKGLDQTFFQVMSAYSKETDAHQANTLPLVLRDQFHIDIYSHADNHK